MYNSSIVVEGNHLKDLLKTIVCLTTWLHITLGSYDVNNYNLNSYNLRIFF